MTPTEQSIRDVLEKHGLSDGLLEREVKRCMAQDAHERWQHELRSGDKIRIIRDRTNPDWYDRIYPVGKEGQVVGFAIRSVPRFRKYDREKPGIYVDKKWVYVKLNYFEVRVIPISSLDMIDDDAKERRVKHSRAAHPNTDTLPHIKIYDLPEMTFWEDDIVALKNWDNIPKPESRPDPYVNQPNVFKIWSFRFCKQGEIIESLDQVPRYILTDRWHTRTMPEHYLDFQMELIARGNVWHAHHDEPLVFADLAEEAAYRERMGEYRQTGICYTPSEDMSNKDEALKKVRNGEGHTIRFFDEFHGWSSTTGWEIISFNDEELGARLVKATLEDGFILKSSDTLPQT